jgi:hypothetical protein
LADHRLLLCLDRSPTARPAGGARVLAGGRAGTPQAVAAAAAAKPAGRSRPARTPREPRKPRERPAPAPAPAPPPADAAAAAAEKPKWTRSKVLQLFMDADDDHSGNLDQGEFMSLLKKMELGVSKLHARGISHRAPMITIERCVWVCERVGACVRARTESSVPML